MTQPTTLGDPFVGWLAGGDRSWMFVVPFTGWCLEGCAVFLAVTTLTILLLAGVGIAFSRKRELHRRWTTWAIIIPAVGVPIWIGKGTTALLATLLGLQAIRKLARMTRLSRPETILLCVLAILYPLTVWQRPNMMALAPVMVLVRALPAVVAGDTANGVRRATLTGLVSIRIPWSLVHPVILWHDASLIAFTAAAADVVAWTGGTGLKRLAWARRLLSSPSPNKTVSGLVGVPAGAVATLTLLGHITPGFVAAVDVGDVLGDSLEPMVKHAAGARDAGDWLSGFGGLFGRADSPLLVPPLAAVLG